MPKLKQHELGDVGELKCCHKPCTKGALCNGSGWQLPFCREHLEALPAALLRKLNRSAGKSVYDLDAVAEAIQLVADARRLLKPKGRGK